MDIIKGTKVSLEPLRLVHVYEMRVWDKYDSQLFHDYNFPELDDEEVKGWLYTRVNEKNSKTYAIILNDNRRTIGIINIKDIRRILRVSNLGISFDPKYIEQGYGTDAIMTLLKYYFESMQMRIIYLDVAKHNTRAINCYKKCGFKIIKKYIIKDKDINIEDIEIKNVEDYFTFKNNTLYLYCYRMKLTKNDYTMYINTK